MIKLKIKYGNSQTDLRFPCTEKEMNAALERIHAEDVTPLELYVTHFISGMAMGVDIFAAEAVLKLKEKYPQIKLECAIPCETQANKWSEGWRNRYFDTICLPPMNSAARISSLPSSRMYAMP